VRTFHEEDLDDLWHHTVQDALVFAPKDKIDTVTGLSTKVFDCLMVCDSMEFSLDIGRDLWLTRHRFNKLKRDYLPRDDTVPQFIERAGKIMKKDSKRGVVTQMSCRVHGERAGNYQWGNCMIGYTFRGGGKWSQPTFGLHARASSISDIGAIDLALAWCFAQEIGKQASPEIRPEEMAFRWFLDSLQWQALKGLPYLHAHELIEDIDDEDDFPSPEYPTIRNTRRCLRKLRTGQEKGLVPDDEPYGPWKRMRQRWYAFQDGQLPKPSVPLESLTLE
jgi:hypothetical protein